eukprot:GHVU01008727.1.p1 GENE.GHVU01008727.1~~GHVU01008727.1.p1  ORF type:complete len:875 (+),score=105.20 GHVU01008727.1:109-2625(+)
MSAEKKRLQENVKAVRSFYQWHQQHRSQVEAAGGEGNEGPDAFLSSFNKLYHNSSKFKEGMLVGLVKAVVARVEGRMNARVSEQVIALCQAVHCHSPSAYRIMKNNVFGVSERHIRTVEARDRGSCVLDDSTVHDRVDSWAEKLYAVKKARILVSVSFDATKVPAREEVSAAFKAVVGGMSPSQLMPLSSDRKPIQQTALATEAKCYLLTTHDIVEGISPMRLIAARPQSTNERTQEYNVETVNAVSRSPHLFLVSVAADGLSSDSGYVRSGLINFLLGKQSAVFLVDPNHAAKAMRSQLVLGTRVVTLGRHLFDTGLLDAAGVKKELIAVTDFTSDVVVLELCSEDTLTKLQAIVESEERGNVVVTALSLFFLRCFLIAVNSKTGISCKDRVSLLWACLLWMTSLDGVHYTTRQNVSTSIIGSIWLVYQKGVSPRLCTTEPIEHFFGFLRCWRREFTVKDLVERVSKLETTFTNMMTHGVIPGSSKQGYMCGFDSYNKQIQQMRKSRSGGAGREGSAGTDDDGVDVNRSDIEGESVAHQLQGPVIDTINWVSTSMKGLLESFGCSSTDASPFCRTFTDAKELASVYSDYMAKDHKGKSRSRGEVNAESGGMASHVEEWLMGEREDEAQGAKEEELDNLAPIINNLQVSLQEESESENTQTAPALEVTPAAERSVTDGIDLSAFYDILWLQADELAGNTAFLLAKECLKACKLQRQGRSDALQKAKSLAGRWWSTVRVGRIHSIAECASNRMTRNDVFLLEGQHVRVLSVYQKSYNKLRIVESGDSSEATVVHFARVRQLYDRLVEDSDLKAVDRYQLAYGSRFTSAQLVTRVSETQE